MNFPARLSAMQFEEFNRRWIKARVAAIRNSDPRRSLSAPRLAVEEEESEEDALEEVILGMRSGDATIRATNENALLRRVFDNSRKLALSFSRSRGLTFEVEDFQVLLEASEIPCLQGEWSARAKACIVVRKGCGFCLSAGSLACDYWREALDGLITGLGDKERLARHASVRHGDNVCIDVIFSDVSDTDRESLAWGPVPDHMAVDLFEMTEYFRHGSGITVEIKGFREGTLYFEFRSSTDTLCGIGKNPMLRFSTLIVERFPGLTLKDITPKAVLGTKAASA